MSHTEQFALRLAAVVAGRPHGLWRTRNRLFARQWITRWWITVLRCGAFIVALLANAGVVRAACVPVPDPYFTRFRCDIYNEADLRQVDQLSSAIPYPSVVATLRANVTLAGTISFGRVNDLTLDTNGFTLTGRLDTNRTWFIKNGAGTFAATGASRSPSFPFEHLRIQGGIVRLSTDLANDSSLTYPYGGPVLDLGGGGCATCGNPPGASSVVLQAAAPVTIAWTVELAGYGLWFGTRGFDTRFDETFDTNGFAVNVTGSIYGAGRLVKVGDGRLTLTGDNFSLGGVLVREGIVRVSSDRALGVLPADSVEVCDLSPFDGPPCTSRHVITPLTLDGGTLEAGATFTMVRPVVLGSRGGTFDTSGFSLTLNGAVDGAGGLTKNGAGTLLLAGPATYAGPTVVNGGTLLVGAPNALPAGTAVTLASGASLDGNEHNLVLGSLSGAGTLHGRSGSLFVGSDNTSTSFSGTIATAGSLTKTGTGTLFLTAAQPYAGATRVALGRLDIAGLAGSVSVDRDAVLTGSGRIGGSAEISGTLMPGQTSTSTLVPLAIAGDLRLDRSATLAIQVNASRTNLLQVDGRTTIDGAQLMLTGIDGVLPRVRTMPLFTSIGGVSGQFGGVSASGPIDAIVASRGSTSYVVLERTDVPLAPLATTTNGRAAGTIVDALRSTATGDLRQVIRELGALTDSDVGNALSQLGGSAAPAALRAGAVDAQDVLQLVNDRLVDVRTVVREAGSGAAVSGAGGRATDVWFKGTGTNSSADASDSRGRLYGGLAGVDHAFAQRTLVVGAFGGYDRASFDVDVASSNVGDRRYRVGGYTTATIGRAYVAGALAGAVHRFETTRRLAFGAEFDQQFGDGPVLGGIDRTAASRYPGHDVSGFFESGVSQIVGPLFAQPFGGLDASRMSTSAFTENGAGAVSLRASDATTSSIRAAVGIRGARNVASGGTLFVPRVEIRYLRELADTSATLPVTFADASTLPFAIQSAPAGRNAVGASAGMVLRTRSRATVSADYHGVFASGDRRHMVSFGLAF